MAFLAALPPAFGERVTCCLLTSVRFFLLAPAPVRHTHHTRSAFRVPLYHKVEPRMRPFYTWFTAVVVFLIAAVSPLPFALPVPLTGILLVALVLSVCALPYYYGCIYIRLAVLGDSREPSLDDYDGELDERGGASNSMACEFAMEEEDGLFGREIHPLLGSSSAGAAEFSRCSVTWRQCIQVSWIVLTATRRPFFGCGRNVVTAFRVRPFSPLYATR